MKPVDVSSGRGMHGVVLDPDQRDFSGNVEVLLLIASSRKNSNTDLNRIDETHGTIFVEDGDLALNGRNSDRQTHAHNNHQK